MATVGLTTSPTTLDSGTSEFVTVVNAGTTEVRVSRGGVEIARLQVGQSRTVYPEGTAVTAVTVSGTGSVTTTAQAARQSQQAQYAADPAFTGTYASKAGPNAYTGTQDFTGATVTGVGSVIETVNTVAASGAAVTLPAVTTATISNVTLTANCTLTFPAAAAGANFTLRLLQDATGARAVTWPASVKWPGAVAPILSTTAGRQDVLSFLCIDGSTWLGFLAGLDMR